VRVRTSSHFFAKNPFTILWVILTPNLLTIDPLLRMDPPCSIVTRYGTKTTVCEKGCRRKLPTVIFCFYFMFGETLSSLIGWAGTFGWCTTLFHSLNGRLICELFILLSTPVDNDWWRWPHVFMCVNLWFHGLWKGLYFDDQTQPIPAESVT